MARFGIEVDKLYRRFLLYPDGKDDEVNIYGEGKREGKKVYTIGEAKPQLGRRTPPFRSLMMTRADGM